MIFNAEIHGSQIMYPKDLGHQQVDIFWCRLLQKVLDAIALKCATGSHVP